MTNCKMMEKKLYITPYTELQPLVAQQLLVGTINDDEGISNGGDDDGDDDNRTKDFNQVEWGNLW